MIELVSYGECSMKRLLIGLLLVALLVSGCRQAVVTIPPLSAPIPTTTALTWDSVASLPVGTIVELTGYCLNPIKYDYKVVGYFIGQLPSGGGIRYIITSNTIPPSGEYMKIKVRVVIPTGLTKTDGISHELQEISRTVIN